MRTAINRLASHFIQAVLRSAKYGYLLALASLAWSYIITASYLANQFDFYPVNKLALGLILFAFIYLGLSGIAGHFLLPGVLTLSRKDWIGIFLLGMAVAGVVMYHFSPPAPAFAQQHSLRITPTGLKNELSKASTVEISKLRYLNGSRIASTSIQLGEGWDVQEGDALVAEQKAAPIELDGLMPGGIALALRHNDASGIVEIEWDGVIQRYDLFTSYNDAQEYVLFRGSLWDNPLPSRFLSILFLGLYFWGITCLVVLGALVIRVGLFAGRIEPFLLVIVYGVIFLAFLNVRLTYPEFNGERALRDTYSYIAIADQPLSSPGFWINERTFTFPLLLKITGTDLTNYLQPEQMRRVTQLQTWLSIVCWTALGLALARVMRRRWCGPIAFGLVLFFSLNLEISMWDSFLLSESASFSFFALVIAGWIMMDKIPAAQLQRWVGYLYLAGLIIVTMMFSFARDINLYVVIFAALLLLVSTFTGKKNKVLRTYSIVYLVAVLALFLFQSITISSGDRWQVHIYDQLALRVLRDPKRLAFYQEEGLPVSEKLLSIIKLTGPEYRMLLSTDPELEPVRQWVHVRGKAAFFGYILAHPLESLAEPFSDFMKMINGSNLEYRYPRYETQPVPEGVLLISKTYYPRAAVLMLMPGLILAGITLEALRSQGIRAVWWIIISFFLAVYPMMFIIWHVNPLEIERHAIQIGIQLRLAGWMALALLLDQILHEKNKGITNG